MDCKSLLLFLNLGRSCGQNSILRVLFFSFSKDELVVLI